MKERPRALYEAYAAGVRTFDARHPAAPEFLAFGGAPEPWRARDCVLVAQLMFEDLGYDAASKERDFEIMDAALPASLVAFLTPWVTPLDAPLDAPLAPPAGGASVSRRPAAVPAFARTPSATELNLRRRAALAPPASPTMPGSATLSVGALAAHVRLDGADRGSNNWAIAPSRSATGGAIAAGDPHLGLRVPVIWHRERLETASGSDGRTAITGVTLPGLPGVVFGSNGAVAWSGTNLEGDFIDLVHCAIADPDTLFYEGPAGREPFGFRREVFRVRGAPHETLLVRTTRFGPIVGPAHGGGLLAVQWTALDPAMHVTGLYDLPGARSVRDLFDRIRDYRGPALNIVAADREGHIGWRVAGQVPRRVGYDPTRPRDARTSGAGWFGYVGADSIPEILDPASGFLWSANQRTLAPDRWQKLGRAPAMPWRARRIAEALASRERWSVEDCVRLQNDLDDAFLGITAEALESALAPDSVRTDSTLAAVRAIVGGWNRSADSTSVAHALLRFVRTELSDLLLAPLIAPCVALDSTFVYDWNLADEVVRRLLEERPMHLLDPEYEDYDALVRAAARRGVAALRARVPGVALESIAWGRVNRARIHHPLGDAVPALGRWFNMPEVALAGDSHVLRVARPRSGASMRMVADLTDPERSRFALPGGQSGHFLSRHYGDHFADWVAGRTVPLEPGATTATIVLTRARTASR
jgi:penicillin amidase